MWKPNRQYEEAEKPIGEAEKGSHFSFSFFNHCFLNKSLIKCYKWKNQFQITSMPLTCTRNCKLVHALL